MRLGACLLLAVALSACGSAAPTDAQIARRALITGRDLPPGWHGVPTARAVHCPVLKSTQRAASAVVRSDEFARVRDAGLQTSVWMFPSARAARRAFAALSGAPVQRCYSRRLVRSIASVNHLVLGQVRRAPLALARIGDARSGARVSAGLARAGATATLDVDLTFVRTGRSVTTGVFVNLNAPLDPALRMRLLRLQCGRLATALDLRT